MPGSSVLIIFIFSLSLEGISGISLTSLGRITVLYALSGYLYLLFSNC